ncbi:MADF domain-containing protein [Trichonephila inaurata madagascariensis]|uniref:MADF domain-containing protein n=1 Tax=Trichonephila inaurata madagascariensis TaxID=2747483 RepID=A0A8X7BUY8_9ARAC|nr:MADF domain-containing protein [Trichonephila inaurata madagascariensis]
MANNGEKLITEVQNYSHLYDLFNKNHKNKVMRENAWKEIGVSLGLSGDLCKNRFKVLRDRYRKEKAKVLPSGSEAKARKMWPFSEMLNFLDPYMQKGRKSTPNLKKRKRAREDLIDAALMKIGGETDPEDLFLEFCSKSIKKYHQKGNEALESIGNYVFQMNKKYLQ